MNYILLIYNLIFYKAEVCILCVNYYPTQMDNLLQYQRVFPIFVYKFIYLFSSYGFRIPGTCVLAMQLIIGCLKPIQFFPKEE